MIDFGLIPDVVSFGASIAACARSGAWPTGLALFHAMPLGKRWVGLDPRT